MAIKRLTIDGFGQVEINNCAFRRDGRIEAQCAPDTTSLTNYVENGMLLAVDNTTRKVKIPTDASLPIGLVYSAEHNPDERKSGLKDFALGNKGDYLPRIGYLAVGDKYITNCISYNTTEFTNDSVLISALGSAATSAMYGGISTDGAVLVSHTQPTVGPVLKITKKTTVPNGTIGVQFQVIKD